MHNLLEKPGSHFNKEPNNKPESVVAEKGSKNVVTILGQRVTLFVFKGKNK